LEVEFLITDPEAQPGVVLDVEPGMRPVQLLEPYSANKDVRCAFCPQRQVHKHGYLALLPDGSKALCGNVCAEDYFGKVTVAALDRKRDQLAAARLKKGQADSIIGSCADLLPLIDEVILPNEWEAEAAMLELNLQLNAAIKEHIRGSGVLGVEFLGNACRAFGDARGGIAALLTKADGATEAEAAKMLAKRAAVIQRIEQGTKYLQEAAAFFEHRNLLRFREWVLANNGFHTIRSIHITKTTISLKREAGRECGGNPYFEKFQMNVPVIKAPDVERLRSISGWPILL